MRPKASLIPGVALLALCLVAALAFGQSLPVRTLSVQSSDVTCLAFSPDGTLLASASNDNSVKLWYVATTRELRTLTGHIGPVSSVAFSPDGALLASGSADGTVRLWDVATGAVTRTLEGHGWGVLCVAFSPDGTLLASGAGDYTARLWNVTTGALVRILGTMRVGDGLATDWVLSVSFSPDGKLLAAGMLGNKLRLWDVATGVVARTLSGKNDSYASVAFSPDGKLLAAGLLSNEVRLWDVATGAVARTLSGHTDSVWSVVFSADGEVLASASSDQTVKVWNVLTGTAIYTLTGQSDGVNSIAFSPDEKLLASSSGRRVKLWDITSVLPGGSQPSSPSGAATPSPTTSLPADVVQLGNYRLRMVPLIKCASAQGRPYTSILISTDGEKDWTIIPDVLLDSGADMSMFPAPVADALGIDLSACQAMTFSGVGGTTTAYLSEVYIAVVHFGGAEADVDGYILSSGGEPFVFKAAATFTSDAANADTYLLGREDVFDYLSLSFQGDTATVTVSER